jgi:hypothetical protein
MYRYVKRYVVEKGIYVYIISTLYEETATDSPTAPLAAVRELPWLRCENYSWMIDPKRISNSAGWSIVLPVLTP